MSVKLFLTVSIVFFPVDTMRDFAYLISLFAYFQNGRQKKVIGYEYSPGNPRNVFFGP